MQVRYYLAVDNYKERGRRRYSNGHLYMKGNLEISKGNALYFTRKDALI